jgi:hypothetical protein
LAIQSQKAILQKFKSKAESVLDLCGPFSTPSLFGSKYFVTFINDFSRKTWVMFLKKKSNTLFAFKAFKNEVEKQIGKVVKIFRLYNNGKYISSAFTKYCEECKR